MPPPTNAPVDARRLSIPVFAAIAGFLVVVPGISAWAWTGFRVGANSEKIAAQDSRMKEALAAQQAAFDKALTSLDDDIDDLQDRITKLENDLTETDTNRRLAQQALGNLQRTVNTLNRKMDQLLGLPVVGTWVEDRMRTEDEHEREARPAMAAPAE